MAETRPRSSGEASADQVGHGFRISGRSTSCPPNPCPPSAPRALGESKTNPRGGGRGLRNTEVGKKNKYIAKSCLERQGDSGRNTVTYGLCNLGESLHLNFFIGKMGIIVS